MPDIKKIQKNKELAYRKKFLTDEKKPDEITRIILADLRIYCHATKSTFDSDIAIMARLEGRREVFNRIMSFLKIDYDDYFNLNEDYYD